MSVCLRRNEDESATMLRASLSIDFLVPLQNLLMRIFHDCNLLGFPGKCQFKLSEEGLERHKEKIPQYEGDWYLLDIIKGQLRPDDDGWVSIERWEATNKTNRHLPDMYMKAMNEEMSPEEANGVTTTPGAANRRGFGP